MVDVPRATRSCDLCPPGKVRPCLKCGASTQHMHLWIVDRRGDVRADVPLCGPHAEGMTVGRTRLLEAGDGP